MADDNVLSAGADLNVNPVAPPAVRNGEAMEFPLGARDENGDAAIDRQHLDEDPEFDLAAAADQDPQVMQHADGIDNAVAPAAIINDEALEFPFGARDADWDAPINGQHSDYRYSEADDWDWPAANANPVNEDDWPLEYDPTNLAEEDPDIDLLWEEQDFIEESKLFVNLEKFFRYSPPKSKLKIEPKSPKTEQTELKALKKSATSTEIRPINRSHDAAKNKHRNIKFASSSEFSRMSNREIIGRFKQLQAMGPMDASLFPKNLSTSIQCKYLDWVMEIVHEIVQNRPGLLAAKTGTECRELGVAVVLRWRTALGFADPIVPRYPSVVKYRPPAKSKLPNEILRQIAEEYVSIAPNAGDNKHFGMAVRSKFDPEYKAPESIAANLLAFLGAGKADLAYKVIGRSRELLIYHGNNFELRGNANLGLIRHVRIKCVAKLGQTVQNGPPGARRSMEVFPTIDHLYKLFSDDDSQSGFAPFELTIDATFDYDEGVSLITLLNAYLVLSKLGKSKRLSRLGSLVIKVVRHRCRTCHGHWCEVLEDDASRGHANHGWRMQNRLLSLIDDLMGPRKQSTVTIPKEVVPLLPHQPIAPDEWDNPLKYTETYRWVPEEIVRNVTAPKHTRSGDRKRKCTEAFNRECEEPRPSKRFAVGHYNQDQHSNKDAECEFAENLHAHAKEQDVYYYCRTDEMVVKREAFKIGEIDVAKFREVHNSLRLYIRDEYSLEFVRNPREVQADLDAALTKLQQVPPSINKEQQRTQDSYYRAALACLNSRQKGDRYINRTLI